MKNIIQQFECYVEEINNDTFTALLIDITLNKTIPEEIATFNISMLNKSEKEYLKEGAIFYWYIYEDEQLIVFDKKRFTKEYIERANKKAIRFKEI
jgi:hypothetical protein